jgi:uncharacterized membrane protein YfcA
MIGLAASATLWIAALLTGTFSAVAGVGGGVLMLAAITIILDFELVLPVFGATQTSSAFSRMWLFRKHLDPSMILTFGVGFIPAAALSGLGWYYFVQNEDAQPYIKMVIAIYLLMYLNFPKFRVSPGNRTRLLLSAGTLCGFAVFTVGAVGPVFAPFIEALEITKERAIATFGVVAAFSNIVKLPLFFLISDRVDWSVALLIGLLLVSTFAGTYIGRHIQHGISEAVYTRLFRTVLGLMGLKLLIWDGLRVVLG